MLCWGKRVSAEFRFRVTEIGFNLNIDPSYLMACMYFESGGTFSSSVKNLSGSGAVGLIQFMPAIAQALGTSIEKLVGMSPVQQLDYVGKYFLPAKGKLFTLADVYMAILWPGAIGKPSGYVLFDRRDKDHPKRYMQNKGLDWNKDGKVTKEEACQRVRAVYLEGNFPQNCI